MMVALVVDHRGNAVKAFRNPEHAAIEAKRLNEELSPWEKMAGYYYGMSGAIELVEEINDLDNRK